jgi:DNA-binding response OmpR family regulator
MKSNILSDTRILVASSEDIIRNFLKIELQNNGYQILIARDGIEALYMINTLNMTESPFDLYLIDTSLKKLGYIKLIDKIKSVKAIKPVILLVNDLNLPIDYSRNKYQLIGMIQKPFLKEELLAQIAAFLGEK